MIYKITPLADCKQCHGSGTIYDTVPYGSTTASMPSDCSCVDEQVPEEFDDYQDEIEIVILPDTSGYEYDRWWPK